jgi:hypothetical protein
MGSATPRCEGRSKGKNLAAQLMQREIFCKSNRRNDNSCLEKFWPFTSHSQLISLWKPSTSQNPAEKIVITNAVQRSQHA